MQAPRDIYRHAFVEHQRQLWGLLYRMTGCGADADDLLQETFSRAMERPPRALDRPLLPWLVRVAMNLARDHLRARRRRRYVGPWLPSPLPTDQPPPAHEPALARGETTEARYDLLESVSFAFLLALEALTPAQRAVLLLADVFDYSGKEVAAALGMSEANVKTTHHRARKAMVAYDRARSTAWPQEQSAAALRTLAAFFESLTRQDVPAIEALLAEDVRVLTDGAGETYAALRPVLGRSNVGRFYRKLTAKRGPPSWFAVRTLNGLPAVLLRYSSGRPRDALDTVLLFELDEGQKIRAIHNVAATRKLRGLRFGDEPGP